MYVNARTPADERRAAEREAAQRRSQFVRFVERLPIMGTSVRTWESELGREQYQEWRDILIRTGWAEWTSVKKDGTPNETQGWRLTEDVATIVRRIED